MRISNAILPEPCIYFTMKRRFGQSAPVEVCPQMLLESYLTAGRVAWVMIGFPQPKHQTQETRNGV